TMYQPSAPATTATIVPARNALTMNGYWKSCMPGSERLRSDRHGVAVPVGVPGRGFGLADHDQPAVGGPQHLHRRPVQVGEDRGPDHLVGRAADRAAPGDIGDPVEVADDRVDVVGDQHDGDLVLAADLRDQPGHGGLARQVEAVERLVEYQQLGLP